MSPVVRVRLISPQIECQNRYTYTTYTILSLYLSKASYNIRLRLKIVNYDQT